MAGLPFTSMPAAQAVDAQGNVTNLGLILGNLRTGQDEPVYTERDYRRSPDASGRPVVEMAPTPREAVIQSDPLATYTQTNKAQLDNLLAEVQKQRAALEESVRPDLEAAYRDYMIDFETLKNSNMDPEQKKQRAQSLYAGYQKKALRHKDKIAGDLKLLDQASEKAKTDAALELVQKQAVAGTIASIGQNSGWSPYEIKRQQMKALLGVVLPAEEQPKAQTPVQRLNEIRPILNAWEDALLWYRIKDGKVQVPVDESKWTGGTPSNPGPTDKEWQDAGWEQEQEFWRLKRGVLPLREEQDQLRRSIAGRPLSNLASVARNALNPVAQSIPRPTDPNDVRQLSTEELRRLAGM